MPSIDVRPFRRGDREQLTALINAHGAAVIPGASVSVNTVMSQLEREPGEFVVDPWVVQRATLIAEQRQRVVAAAHLLRYAGDDKVGESYRDAGEIRWLLFWPEAPYWPDSVDAGNALITACIDELDRWDVQRQYADGALPMPGVFGIPEQWPHVHSAYERAGFRHEGHSEMVYIARLEDLPRGVEAPSDLILERSVGINGTRLAAAKDGEIWGYIEVGTLHDAARLPRHGGLADIGNLHVAEDYRRCGLGTWLVEQAAEWLCLGGADRLLAYAEAEHEECTAFLRSANFRELTRTKRGWVRRLP